MSIIYPARVQPASPNQRKLTGTRHEGLICPKAARKLRTAVCDTADKAAWCNGVTPDVVAAYLLKHLDELHPGSLLVLSLTAAILIRESRR
jgi:hypothetical protein